LKVIDAMLKQVLLVVGIVALYLAAKEYGVNSLDDVKSALSQALKFVDLDALTRA
jgi:hypothetical protein